MTAIQFLSATAETSDIINPDGRTESGAIIIQFDGAMADDEKWQIEQAAYDETPANLVWQAVHTTDFLTATHAPGTTNQNMTVDRWAGPRAGNRVFEVPTVRGYVYRARLVYKGGTAQNTGGTAISNTAVTATWGQVRVKAWFN